MSDFKDELWDNEVKTDIRNWEKYEGYRKSDSHLKYFQRRKQKIWRD